MVDASGAAPWAIFMGEGMTKGELEAEVSRKIVRFEREQAGRGPSDVRTYLLEDMVIVRLQESLTQVEKTLIRGRKGEWNIYLVKQLRTELVENTRDVLVKMVSDTLGMDVISVHSDLSTRTGESILVFVLAKKGDW